MTFLRKWRFPILIASGLIAAGGLVYFANTHVSTNKTQGAIGKRDVYRDGQDNSADVATPGSAPVATQAILESSDYKSLAKNPAFQQLISDGTFAKLSQNSEFMQLLRDKNFQEIARNASFADLLHTEGFKQALSLGNARLDTHIQNNHELNTQFKDLLAQPALAQVLRSENFARLASDSMFLKLVSSSELRQSLNLQMFPALIARSDFSSLVVMGNGGNVGGGCQKAGSGEACGGTR
ncbi:MAG: hypothetical protein ACLPWF_30975 [Bryobacteraceae bacterium]